MTLGRERASQAKEERLAGGNSACNSARPTVGTYRIIRSIPLSAREEELQRTDRI